MPSPADPRGGSPIPEIMGSSHTYWNQGRGSLLASACALWDGGGSASPTDLWLTFGIILPWAQAHSSIILSRRISEMRQPSFNPSSLLPVEPQLCSRVLLRWLIGSHHLFIKCSFTSPGALFPEHDFLMFCSMDRLIVSQIFTFWFSFALQFLL